MDGEEIGHGVAEVCELKEGARGGTKVLEAVFLHEVFYFLEARVETSEVLDHGLCLGEIGVDFGDLG